MNGNGTKTLPLPHFTIIVALAAITALASSGAIAQVTCPGDFNGNGHVTVDEIIGAVNYSLNECPTRFVDNTDGTITDNWTGLVWEKKSDDDSIHDKDNLYTWCVDNNDDDTCADP